MQLCILSGYIYFGIMHKNKLNSNENDANIQASNCKSIDHKGLQKYGSYDSDS